MRRVRRVVTGHDGDGRATVSIDDMPQRTPSRPGVTYWVAWTSEGFPVDNTVDGDQATPLSSVEDVDWSEVAMEKDRRGRFIGKTEGQPSSPVEQLVRD